MQPQALEGGFADVAVHSAIAFRSIMRAMARPGEILDVAGAHPPQPLSIAAGTLLLTLCDPDTPIFLSPKFDTYETRDWVTFHTGAPMVDPQSAQFALGTWDELKGLAFSIGTPEYPDRSATLIVESPSLASSGATLRGPGIKDTIALSLPEVEAFQNNAGLFPLGYDYFFTHGARIAALPRTTKVS